MLELSITVDESEPEPCEEDDTSLYDTLSPQDQIILLAYTISIVENQTLVQDAMMAADVLQRIKRDLRWQI